jgi:hypothetical protein
MNSISILPEDYYFEQEEIGLLSNIEIMTDRHI